METKNTTTTTNEQETDIFSKESALKVSEATATLIQAIAVEQHKAFMATLGALCQWYTEKHEDVRKFIKLQSEVDKHLNRILGEIITNNASALGAPVAL